MDNIPCETTAFQPDQTVTTEEDFSSIWKDCGIPPEHVEENHCSLPLYETTPPDAGPSAEMAALTLSIIEDGRTHLSPERFLSCYSTPDDSNEQKPIECDRDDDEVKQTYRMHLATVPGSMANQFILQEALPVHQHLLNFIKRFLECEKIVYQLLDECSFSCTSEWGVEPYGCLLVTCTRTMISGLCALFGMAFRQHAVGVFTCFTNDKDEPHNVFLVRRLDGLRITVDEALQIVNPVCVGFPTLSAQRDETGASMEFHDYCNEAPSDTSKKLIELLSDPSHSHCSYVVSKDNAKSFLLEEANYHQAIQKAGLESYELIIQMCGVHSRAYPTH